MTTTVYENVLNWIGRDPTMHSAQALGRIVLGLYNGGTYPLDLGAAIGRFDSDRMALAKSIMNRFKRNVATAAAVMMFGGFIMGLSASEKNFAVSLIAMVAGGALAIFGAYRIRRSFPPVMSIDPQGDSALMREIRNVADSFGKYE